MDYNNNIQPPFLDDQPMGDGLTAREQKEIIGHVVASDLWDRIDEERAMGRVHERVRMYRRRRVVHASISAAAMLLIGFFVFFLENQKYTTDNIELAHQSGGKDGFLRLLGSDGEEYLLNDTIRQLSIGGNERVIVKEGDKLIITKPAETDEKEEVQYITLVIPRGKEYQLVLEDGTTVWLNAESSFTFPDHFPDSSRQVELTGEAYFEVTTEKTRPFRVQSGEMMLEVLGTIFNVSAYPESGSIVTTLLEGSVKQSFGEDKKEYVLHPNEQTRYVKKMDRVDMVPVDADDYRLYREGRVVFRDTPLGEILITLGRAYDYSISMEEITLYQEAYTIAVNKRENIETALNKLKEIGGFAYEIKENRIRIY